MSNSAGPKITKDGLVLDFDAANYKSYPAAQDTYVNNVSLMLDGESLTDKSQNNFTVTNSSVAVSSAQVKYGTSSLYFNGASYLSIPDSTAFGFGTGDFTIEFWLKLGAAITATSGDASYRAIVNKYSAGSNGTEDAFYVFLNNAAGTMQFNVGFVSNTTASNFAFNITGVDTSLNSVWNHVAVVRSSGSLKVYFNGTQIGTTQTYSSSINQGTLPLLVGARTYAPIDLYLNGYIDDLRITKTAIYTANFTPSTGPLSLPGVITDLTKNKNVGTFISGPTYSAGSIVFDGVNDYINIPASTNLTFGTGDFTMEVWCKTRAKTMLYPALLSVNLGWAANVWALVDRHNVTASTKFTFHTYNIGSPLLTSATAPSNGVWYNVVVTRIGTLFSLYINGVLESTATSSASIDGGVSNSINLGRTSASDSSNYDGNIPLARIYKGKGLTSGEVYNNFVANRGRFGV